MKKCFLLLMMFFVAIMATAAGAEQAGDISLGKVKMRSGKLDKKARGEVAALAAKIKKQRKFGVIKLRGDFPAAVDAEEYLSKSVFMAREVETYLAPLLKAKFQVFVTASSFSGASSGEGSVEVLLYPYELRLEELESLRYVSSQAGPLPETPVEPSQAAQQDQPVESVEVIERIETGGMLSPPREETGYTPPASRREREKQSSEDPALANELVNKAKARAAERAKRRAAED